jgi:crotonobetainyl-CoA:carnitine CoA-transferase CaiB-like acyl-CoA transferase
MMLADLGADVIKVERPGSGDETRGWGPPFDADGESAYYLSINRNKLSVAADLDHDRDLIDRLARQADVLVENFLPGALTRAGFDADGAMRANAKLVWCTITGFGEGSARPGYDFVVQAESGWMAITGEPAGEPMKAGVALADIIAGKDAAIAILAALAGRAAGASRRIVISLEASARAALVNVAQNALVAGTDARRWGNAHANLVPYQLFDAADRPIVIAVGTDAQWVACARALGLSGLAADPALRTNAGRLAQRDRVTGAMRQVVRTRNALDWIRTLDAARVPCGLVRAVADVVRDAGASPSTGMPPATGGAIRRAPPRLDEHGALVRAHGWDAFAMTVR